MHVTLTLKLRDAPGELLEALKPIAAHRGNIISIAHVHEQAKDGFVPTMIVLNVPDTGHLMPMVSELEKVGKVIELRTDGHVLQNKISVSVLFYGHVMRTDAKNTMDRLGEAGANVSSFSLDISDRSKPSCALLQLDVEEKKYRSVVNEIEKISQEKSLLAIREVVM